MKAIFCAAAIISTVVVSGCAAPRHALSSAEARATSAPACEQVTGSRTGYSADRNECAPVGYPFKQFSLEDFRLLGANDINRLVQPRY